MLVLNGSSESITAVLGGAYSVDWSAHYETESSPGSAAAGANTGNQATTARFTLVAAPNAGYVRKVRFLTARNADNTAVTITFEKQVTTTRYKLSPAILLQPGDSVLWTPDGGFVLLDSTGRRKTDALNASMSPSIRGPLSGRTSGITSVKTMTNSSAFAYYIGKAPSAITSVKVRARVTTAAATITSVEVALAKGAPANPGSNPSLTVVGYADASAVYNATGLKDVTITVSAGQTVNPGDDLWIVIASNATTVLILRAFDAGDDIQSGAQAVATTTQPSTIVGVPTTFTVEANTVLPPWFSVNL